MSLFQRRWLIVSLALVTGTVAAGLLLTSMLGQHAGSASAANVSGDTSAGIGEGGERAEAASTRTAPLTTPPRPTVAVRRGPISETLLLGGRVAAVEEEGIVFPVIGRVEAVFVKPGDTVEEGQVVVQADTTEVQRELSAARARVELGTIRLEQAHAQAQARQRQTEHAAEVERTRRQNAVIDAEAVVRRAEEELVRVRQGVPQSDRRAAEAAITSARSTLESAQAELTRVSAGPSEIELRTADQQVRSAQLALHRAQTEFDRLSKGADPNDVRAAEREVAAAQSALDRARMEYDRLFRGDPTAISAAEREVQRAELALRTAQSTRIDSSGSREAQRTARASREAAIATARLAVQDAQERLAAARRGPDRAEVDVARRNVQSAQSALQTATERLEQVRKGPDELALATAHQAVESAETAVKAAEARYLELAAGPPPDRIAAARSAVQSAHTGVASAMDRLAELNSRPTRAELREAEERLVAARTMLMRVQEEPAPVALEEGDAGAFDRVVLEKNLEQDRAQVATLEQQLAALTLRSPFSGTVSAVHVRPGDPVDRGIQVLAVARPGDPVIHADVSSEDAAKLALGQRARILGDGVTGSPPEATLVQIVDGPGGAGRVAHLQVRWTDTPPAYRAAVQAAITVLEKEHVLLIPKGAVRTSGQRRYVEYMEGDARRTVDVSLGITGATDVEVLSGLREGQLILAGNGAAGATSTVDSTTPAGTAPTPR
jgi:HlyD family secretion protein